MPPPTPLPTRRLGLTGPSIPALGLGLMGLSGVYSTPEPDPPRLALLTRAHALGVTLWDTASAYGDSEDLLGKWFAADPSRRASIFLASKFGLKAAADGSGRIEVDSSPAYCRAQCEASLRRLGTGWIDLYYVHRVDGKTPVEETMGELGRLKEEGKIRHIGLCSVSAETLRRAHAVHPVDAYQVEYSLFGALAIEGDEGGRVLETCRELGVTVFAYAPLGRGVLGGKIRSAGDLNGEGDLRRWFPRFSGENLPGNLRLVEKLEGMAEAKGCTAAQLSLAWLMAQGGVVPIPGTRRVEYLEENVGAVGVEVTAEEERKIREWVEEAGLVGEREIPGMLVEFNDSVPL